MREKFFFNEIAQQLFFSKLLSNNRETILLLPLLMRGKSIFVGSHATLKAYRVPLALAVRVRIHSLDLLIRELVIDCAWPDLHLSALSVLILLFPNPSGLRQQ